MESKKSRKVEEIQSYFKFHRRLLRFFGVDIIGPERSRRYTFIYYSYSFIILIMSFVCTASLWLEVPYLISNIDGMMLNLTFAITYTTTYIKLICYVWNQKDFLELSNASETKHWGTIGHSDKIAKTSKRICKIMIKCVLVTANVSAIGSFIGSFYKTVLYYRNTSLKTLLPYLLPFEIHSFSTYIFLFLCELFCIMWYGNIVIILNTLLTAIIIHLGYKFSNLGLSIQHVRNIALIRLATNKDSYIDLDDMINPLKRDYYENLKNIALNNFTLEQINAEMNKCLKLCIKEHCALIKNVKKLETAYNIGFFAHIFNNLNIINICHLMIQISENNVFSVRGGSAIALIGCVMAEFAVFNYAGHELTLRAANIATCLYDCEWVESDKTFKKMLSIMLTRAQKPVVLTAGKFLTISNDSFVLICRGAYSYFAVIKNTKK